MIEELYDLSEFKKGYKVSKSGRIYSEPMEWMDKLGRRHVKKGGFLMPMKNINGYSLIKIEGKSYRVHVLIAKRLIPNPENKPQVNHINGDKHDNRVENLEWNTAKENVCHSISTGLRIFPLVSKKRKVILNSQTGIYYSGIKEAADSIGINQSTFSNMLCGYSRNRTTLAYV